MCARFLSTFFLLFALYAEGGCIPYEAVVVVPVADVLWRPASKMTSTHIVKKHETLPFSPEKPREACLRSHQLKKNDRVMVIDLVGEEAKCYTYAFKIRKGSSKSFFWTLKRNVVSLEELQKKGIQIPPAIDSRLDPREYNKDVITLSEPWHDTATNQLYSVGTRFLRCEKADTEDGFGVYNADFDLKEKKGCVPKKGARSSYARHFEDAQAPFLELIKAWARLPDQSNGGEKHKQQSRADEKRLCIPYVHGGCSFRGRSEAKGFYESACYVKGKKLTSWHRIGSYQTPLDGFDCSSMILCAAQIVGIPYYWKNTSMLVKALRELGEEETLEEGDLLWYQGHVLVVSDIKKNLAIEAAGYDKGYGKLHELPLQKIFQGIKSYADLVKAARERKKIHRLTSKGRVWKSLSRVKILKLRSVY